MSRVWALAFVLIFVKLNLIQGYKPCNLEDTKCTTKAAQMAFATLVPGLKDICEPLDPFNLATIEGEFPALKFTLTNITVTGLRDCLYSIAKFRPEESTYLSEFICPKMVVQYIYNSKGFIGPVEIEGTGWATVTLNDYNMAIEGYYRTVTSEENHKHNLFIINYYPEFELKGLVTVDIDGTLHNDPVKNALATEYLLKHGKILEKLIRFTIMPKYMNNIVKAMDSYFRAYNVEDIFHEY